MKLRKAYLKSEGLEPGLLRLFRSYVLVIDALFILNLVFIHFEFGLSFESVTVLNLLALAALNFVVFNPPLEKRLNEKYLAVGIVLFLVMTAIQLWGAIQLDMPQGFSGWARLYFSSCFVWLFIPMLITAWQYGLPGSIIFLITTSLLEALAIFINMSVIGNWFIFGFIFFRSLSLLVVAAIISRLMIEQRKQRYDLKTANQQLSHYASTLEQLSTSRERNRLARELHDTLAHTLSGLSVQLEAVRTLWKPAPEQSYTMLEQALQDTRNGLRETRRALEDLRAEPLEDLGLLLALENLCSDLQTKTGVEVDLTLPETFDGASAAVQHCIYRTTQEAFNNIDHHAGAKKVALRLTTESSDLNKNYLLHIKDDGEGFDLTEDVESGHFGLRGMRERVEMMNGTFTLESSPQEGTHIVMTLTEVQS